MKDLTEIELIFSGPAELRKARVIAETMIRVYFRNGCEFLPFDDMKKVNADGWVQYPSRHAKFETVSALKSLWTDYKMANPRSECYAYERQNPDEAAELISHICVAGNRLVFSDCSRIQQDRLIDNRHFEDFFMMLCMIFAAVRRDSILEGMCRSVKPDTYEKRTLTHAVWDGKTLAFEQMEGFPVFATRIVTWTRIDDKFIKSSRRFPSACVVIKEDDKNRVRNDAKLAQWISGVNDVKMEMAAADLAFLHASFPRVMIYAASGDVCLKYRDALLVLLSENGYAYECLKIIDN